MEKSNFIHDTEKMIDFEKLTKEEFLNSYAYLDEEEYESTLELVRGLNNARIN